MSNGRNEPMNVLQEDRVSYSSAEAYGALGDHALNFIKSLAGQEYNRSSIWQYQSCLARLARRMARDDVGLDDLDEATALALISEEQKNGHTSAAFIVRRFVRALVEQGLGKPLPSPTPRDVARAELRQDYERYLC